MYKIPHSILLISIKFVLILLLFFVSIMQSHAQSWVWAKNAGGSNIDHATATATDAVGNVYVAGYFDSPTIGFGSITLTNTGTRNVFLVKYDSLGIVIWARSAGNTGDDEPTSIATDTLGNIYMAGFYESPTITFGSTTLTNLGTRNAFLVKYTPTGSVVWAKSAGGNYIDAATAIATNQDGNVYETGNFSSSSITFGAVTLINTSLYTSNNTFLVKYDSLGNVLWARLGNGDSLSSTSICTDMFGNVFVGGGFHSSTAAFGTTSLSYIGGYDLFLVKYDSLGNLKWAKSAGNTGNEVTNSISADAWGHVYTAGIFASSTLVLGSTTLTNAGNADVFLAKYDTTGSIIWAKRAGGSDTDYATSVATTPAGNIYIAGNYKSNTLAFGTTTLTNSGNIDMFLTKYDSSGSLLFAKTAGSVGDDEVKSIATYTNDVVYMAGNYGSPTLSFSSTLLNKIGTGYDDVFITKLNDTAIRPDVITGILSVCVGGVTTLSNAISGGGWVSNNPSIATIAPSTGIVTGVAAGIDTIIYSIDGYSISIIITVNTFPVPGSISGAASICMYSAIAYTDTPLGGRWQISNSHAIVDATGLVSGISAGKDTLSYIDSNACGLATATKVITVNTSPYVASIFGTNAVCQGATLSLSETTTGGTWGVTNAHATISISGVVHGVSIGIDSVTYYRANLVCTTTVTKIITINPLPNAGTILGSPTICIGATDTYTDTTTVGIGTWGSLSPTKVTMDATGIATGITAGIATIGYTVSNSCGGVTATKTITILPLSNPGIITGPDSVCIGATITYTDTITSGLWTLQNGFATDSAGILHALTPGTDTLFYATTNTCGTVTTSKIITIDPIPYVAIIVGDSGLCPSGATITLTDSVAGGVWHLSDSVVSLAGGVVTSSVEGVDTVFYTLYNACGSATTKKVITVDLYPSAGTIIGADSMCAGVTNIYHSTSTGGVWSNYNPTLDFVVGNSVFATNPGIDTLYYTVTNSCATAIAKKVIKVLSLPVPGVLTGPDTVCYLGTVYFVPSAPSGVWTLSNTNVSIDSGLITGLVVNTRDTITYTVTNFCGTDFTTKSIYVKPLPTVAIITGNDSLCIFSSLTLADATPSGVWSAANGIATVTTGGIVHGWSDGIDTIIYTYTSLCGTVHSTKTVTVEPLPYPGTITAPKDSICLGGSVALAETVTGGTWHSATDSIATITGTGNVSAHLVGIDSIYYTVGNSCGATHTTYLINVLTTVTPFISGRNLICLGINDTVSGYPAGGEWSINNTNATILTTADGGVITGITIGTDTIMYQTTNFCGTTSAESAIQINDIVHPNVTGTTTVCVGKLDTLYATPNGGLWNSSDTNASIATIDIGGIVIPATAGNTTISYSIDNVCGTGSFTIDITILSKAHCDSMNSVANIPTPPSGIALFPNPNTGIFTLSLPQLASNATISVIDLLGKEVFTNTYTTNYQNNISLDVNNLVAGTYIVKIVVGYVVYREKMEVRK